MILRPTMEDVHAVETSINKSKFADYLIPAYSFVSVVEISSYLGQAENPYENRTFVNGSTRLYRKPNIFVSIQWTNGVKETTTGTCFRWKSALNL